MKVKCKFVIEAEADLVLLEGDTYNLILNLEPLYNFLQGGHNFTVSHSEMEVSNNHEN